MRFVSGMISEICIKKGFLQSQDKEIFEYRIELLIQTSLFFAFIFVLSLILHQTLETLFYTGFFYSIRKYIGGWHSSSYTTCFLMSIGCVCLCVYLVGPFIKQVYPVFIFCIGSVFDIIVFFIPPCFSSKTHYSQKELETISIAKRRFAIKSFLIRLIYFLVVSSHHLVFATLGQLTAIVGWIIQNRKEQK